MTETPAENRLAAALVAAQLKMPAGVPVSADGDTVRGYIVAGGYGVEDASDGQPAIVPLDTTEPLAALARLEAAAAEHPWRVAAVDEQEKRLTAEAQRDALAEARDVALIALARRTTQRDAVAEALRKLANPTHEPKGEEAVLLQMEVAQIARTALAEAGLG